MKSIIVFISLFFIVSSIFSQQNSAKTYKLWDDQPAQNRGGDFNKKQAGGFPYDADWEMQSYPLGNGYMGANFFGRTDTERIQITEKTLQNRGMYGLGALTNFAEVYIDFNHDEIKSYKRELNINQALATINYTHNNVEYKREYFMSYPDKVLAIKLSASKKGKISFKLHPELPYLDTLEYQERSGNVVAENNLITLSGTIDYYSINYEAQIKVIADGGEVRTLNNKGKGEIMVDGANEVILLLATGTNYKLNHHTISTRNNREKLDITQKPHRNVSQLITNATTLGYKKLKERHLADFTGLFDRVSLNLKGTAPKIPTHKALEAYKKGDTNTYLEEMLFQYGRYLLIASSRKGALPSGLQGIWSQYQVSPWTGGYWHNINIQMNYWGAFNANLAETFIPYIEYFNAYLPEAQKMATLYIKKNNPTALAAGDNGWTIGTSANPYEIRPAGGHSGPGTGGFTSKLFWEYYDFTRDTAYLRKTAYPALLGMSKFLAKTLKPANNGLLLVEPSASPEQMHDGKYIQTTGATFDQGFVWENHRDVLLAAEVLHDENSFLKVIKEQMDKLDPIIVGKSGQIKEFREEEFYGDMGEKTHRHISHLCPLYPGTLINSSTPKWLKASKVTLNLRGNETTGWAMAHRMNLRARTKQGDQAHEVYSKFIKERTLPNLWTTHPPFQIDGSLGSMAGVAEMLLQSHEAYIEPLAALPKAWASGEFKGLVARGNFEVSVKWKNGKAQSIKILSKNGGDCTIRYPSIAKQKVQNENGQSVHTEVITPHIICLKTNKDTAYLIKF